MAEPAAGAAQHVTADQLPVEVLTAILGRVDQSTRAACLLVNKHVHRAASAGELWGSLRVRDLGAATSAAVVRAVSRHGSTGLRIENDRPDDTAAFLHALVDAGLGDGIEHLDVRMGSVTRVPESLFEAAARLWNLRSLSVEAQHVRHPSAAYFHSYMPLRRLHTLRIVERLSTNLCVTFTDDVSETFEALEIAELRVVVSNLLDEAHEMKKLRRVVYRCDVDSDETHEYACLDGLRLEHLEIDVGADTDYGRLFHELRRCAVERLVLHLHDDHLEIERLNPALTQLAVGFHDTHADVVIDFRHLASSHPNLRSVETFVGADWILADQTTLDSCRHTVRFWHARYQDFMDFARRVSVHIHGDLVVCRD